MDKTQSGFFRHLRLHSLVLIGYVVLFIGSWATCVIGFYFLFPILIGIEYAVFAFYRGEPIRTKDAFRFMDKASRSSVVSHYALLGLIYGVLLSLTPILRHVSLSLLSGVSSADLVGALLAVLITVLAYVSFQTVFSFATIIKVDSNVSTQQALSLSKKMVFDKPLHYIGLRLLFFYRNPVLFMFLVLPLMHHYRIIASPNSVSGNPATMLFTGWFILLVLSTPFYEKMMVKHYLKTKNGIHTIMTDKKEDIL